MFSAVSKASKTFYKLTCLTLTRERLKLSFEVLCQTLANFYGFAAVKESSCFCKPAAAPGLHF